MSNGMAVVLLRQTIDTMLIVKKYKEGYEAKYKNGMPRRAIYKALRADFGKIAVRDEIGGDTYLFQGAKKIIKQHMDITDREAMQ